MFKALMFALVIVLTPKADTTPTLTQKDHTAGHAVYIARNPLTYAIDMRVVCGLDYESKLFAVDAGVSEEIEFQDTYGQNLSGCYLDDWIPSRPNKGPVKRK